MSGPGKGRYTTFLPPKNSKNNLLAKLYNEKSQNGNIYVTQGEPTNLTVANAAVGNMLSNLATDISSGKVKTYYSQDINLFYGDNSQVPMSAQDPQINGNNYKDVPGAPANRYVPNLSSPGGISTKDVVTTNADPVLPNALTPDEVLGKVFVSDADTADPQSNSANLQPGGYLQIGTDLTPGKSPATK